MRSRAGKRERPPFRGGVSIPSPKEQPRGVESAKSSVRAVGRAAPACVDVDAARVLRVLRFSAQRVDSYSRSVSGRCGRLSPSPTPGVASRRVLAPVNE